MKGSRETCCSRCAHLEVCSLKEKLLKAQEGVDNVKIYIQDMDGLTELRLSDIAWIKPVNLSCVHFLERKETVKNIANGSYPWEPFKSNGGK